MKNSQGRGKKSDEPSDVNCSICFGLSHGTEGTKETQLVKGLCFTPWGFFPTKMKTGENGLTAKLPYRSLFTPLPFLPPVLRLSGTFVSKNIQAH